MYNLINPDSCLNFAKKLTTHYRKYDQAKRLEILFGKFSFEEPIRIENENSIDLTFEKIDFSNIPE